MLPAIYRMDNYHELIKSIQVQNESINKLAGLSSLSRLAESIQKMHRVNIDLTGLNGISKIALDISRQMQSFDTNAKKLAAQVAAIQMPRNSFALSGLTSTLSQIAKQNQLVSDRLADLARSQLLVSNSLTEIARSFNQSHLRHFNALNVALQSVSKDFLIKTSISKEWSDLNIVEEANITI